MSNVVFNSTEEAVEVARSIASGLRERVWEAEKLRHLPEQNVTELLDSGLLGLEYPRRWGGSELNTDALIEVTAALAEGCGSTGWVYMIWAAHAWHIAQFPERVQEAVFTDSRPITSTLVNTQGEVRRVDGGYILNCRGRFSSGVDFSTWLMPRCTVQLDPDEPPERVWFLIPRSDYTIIDDWHTVGLQEPVASQ